MPAPSGEKLFVQPDGWSTYIYANLRYNHCCLVSPENSAGKNLNSNRIELMLNIYKGKDKYYFGLEIPVMFCTVTSTIKKTR